MKKTFLILGIGLLVLIIAVGVVAGMYIGPIVKFGMENVGPKITKVSIKVDAVDLSLLTGSAKIKGLIVGNPDGYKTPEAISVGNVAVSVDPFSVLSNKIVVHSVQVESPEITFEGGLGKSNLTRIMDNVNAAPANTGSAPSNNSNNNSEAGNKPAPKIEIDDFLITGAKVHVSLTGLMSKEMTIPLPDIHLTDLGKGSDGLTPAQLTSAVFGAISTDTVKAVTSAAADLGQGVTSLGKGVGTGAANSLSSVTKSITNLFGK